MIEVPNANIFEIESVESFSEESESMSVEDSFSSSDDSSVYSKVSDEPIYVVDFCDIASLAWIKENPQFSELEGALIPINEQAGWFKSAEIVTTAFLRNACVSDEIKFPLFEELWKLFHQGPIKCKKLLNMICGFSKDVSINLIRFAVLRDDADFVKTILSLREFKWGDLTTEVSVLLSAFIKPRLNEFLNCIGGASKISEQENYLKLVFSLELENHDLEVISNMNAKCIGQIISCILKLPSSELLYPNVKAQALKVYQFLTPMFKKLFQLPLYFRGILTIEQVELKRAMHFKEMSHIDLLGSKRDSIFHIISEIYLLYEVTELAKFDPSIIDWYISRVDRDLKPSAHIQTALSGVNFKDELLCVIDSFPEIRPLALSKDPEFALDATFSDIENRKILSYVFTGGVDFMHFLNEAPIELLPYAEKLLAVSGTAEEF